MMQKGAPALPILSGILILAFAACEKPEEQMLGKDTIPEEERMKSSHTDSLSIEARTVNMPPVPAINSLPGMLGKLNDERTARTRAALYSQLLLPGTNIDLGDPSDLVLDSAVLSLRYQGFYGDTSTAQEFQVHQVIEDMEGISPSHQDSLACSSTLIGSKTRSPRLGQNVDVNGNSLPPQLRIRLKDAFGENILDRSGTSDLANDEAFTDFMNGIRITARTPNLQDKEGSILFMQLPHEHSRVTLYYRNTAENEEHSLDLALDGSHFNQVEHKTAGSDMEGQLDQSFSSSRKKTYVLGPGETATELRFPDLKELAEEGRTISVNSAILELPVEYESKNSPFPPSVSLHLLYEDASGDLALSKDRVEEGADFFGGEYDHGDERYRMRITRHVQAIFNGEVNTNSVLVTTSLPMISEAAANTASRAVLKGPGSSDPPVLELTYTEY